MARWGSDASLLAGEAAAGGMAAAAAAADPAAGGVSAVLLLLLALARDEAGRGELAASPCAGGPGVGLAGRCVALVEAGGGARGRVPQPDVCAAAALLLAELGPTSSGKEELATPRAMRVGRRGCGDLMGKRRSRRGALRFAGQHPSDYVGPFERVAR